MTEAILTINKRPKVFNAEIPANLKIDDVIGSLVLMANLLTYMKDNKPTQEIHEYHINENYFDGWNLDTDIMKVTSTLWQSFYKYSQKGKRGFSIEGSVIFTGSGYEIKGEEKDYWITTKFSDAFSAFLDGKVDIEGMFQSYHEEISKWLEQNEPYKP